MLIRCRLVVPTIMPKIPNYTLIQEEPYPKWEHDETGDSIEIGPSDQTEYDADGTPHKYQITLWARDGLNNRVEDWGIPSLKKARKEAVRIARKHPEGKLVRSMEEKRNLLNWGQADE